MNSSVETYGGQGARLVEIHHDALPFTGLDVTLLGVGAIVLLVAGIAMARMARAT